MTEDAKPAAPTLKDKFFQPIRVSGKDNSFLFWCCTHFCHDPKWSEPIWKQRGYRSEKECTDGLIVNWNKKANYETTGFLLGDIMFGMGGAEKFFSLLSRLEFKELYIMSGNHHAGFKQAIEMSDHNGDYYFSEDKVVRFYPNYLEAFVNGQAVVMSHYPILSWNGQGKGSWMLSGHVHGNLDKSKVGEQYVNSGALCLEVSVEKQPSPISFSEIRGLMRNRSATTFDHHGPEVKNPF